MARTPYSANVYAQLYRGNLKPGSQPQGRIITNSAQNIFGRWQNCLVLQFNTDQASRTARINHSGRIDKYRSHSLQQVFEEPLRILDLSSLGNSRSQHRAVLAARDQQVSVQRWLIVAIERCDREVAHG